MKKIKVFSSRRMSTFMAILIVSVLLFVSSASLAQHASVFERTSQTNGTESLIRDQSGGLTKDILRKTE